MKHEATRYVVKNDELKTGGVRDNPKEVVMAFEYDALEARLEEVEQALKATEKSLMFEHGLAEAAEERIKEVERERDGIRTEFLKQEQKLIREMDRSEVAVRNRDSAMALADETKRAWLAQAERDAKEIVRVELERDEARVWRASAVKACDKAEERRERERKAFAACLKWVANLAHFPLPKEAQAEAQRRYGGGP